MKYLKIAAFLFLILSVSLVGFQNCAQKGGDFKGTGGGGATTTTNYVLGVTCSVSVQPVTHFGESYSYVFSVSGSIPSPVNVAIYGNKSNPDGSNLVTDANGSTVVGMTGTQLNLNYSSAAMVGKYMRFFKLIDPATNQDICTTNQVNQILTPLCSVTVSPATVTAGNSVTMTVNTNTTPSLAAPVAHLYWYGTKNGVQDENGVENWPVSLNPIVIPMSSANIGTYTRYYIAKDAAGNGLCKSNTVTITVN